MYQESKEDKKVDPFDCVPVWIGEARTWVKRCTWERDARCGRVASVNTFCRWHAHCLDIDPGMAEDYNSFLEWHKDQGGGFDTNEAFSACIGEIDPHSDSRRDIGPRQTKTEKTPQGLFVSVNRDFLSGLLQWMKNGPESGVAYMGKMADKHPEHAAAFLIAGEKIKNEYGDKRLTLRGDRNA